MAEMNARLREFLNEVLGWFWAHDYAGGDGDANDLLMAVGNVLREHPEFTSIDLLRDIIEADLGEFLTLNTRDQDVRGVLEDYPDVKSLLDALIEVVVRKILRDEDRPEGWESLPLDQRDGPVAKEDKRRLELARQALNRRYPGIPDL